MEAILYPKLGGKVTREMKNYARNTQICRRRKLFENFLFSDEDAAGIVQACQCCDLCARLCSCTVRTD